LIYDVEEVVLPLECQIPSLRVALQEGLSSEDNIHLRLKKLQTLDKQHLEAQQCLKCYQAQLYKAFNKV